MARAMRAEVDDLDAARPKVHHQSVFQRDTGVIRPNRDHHQPSHRSNTTAELVPPKPNALETTTRGATLRATPGT